MKTSFKYSMLSAVILVLVLCIFVQKTDGQTVITVPNGDFGTGSGTVNSLGLLGSFSNQSIGTASPWVASGSAVGSISLVSVLAPIVDISSGDLTISNMVTLTNLVHNAATVFNNNIGTNFVAGQTYTLTAAFSANTTLNLSLLTSAGFGVSLRAAGTDVANSISNPSLALTVIGTNSGTISMTYTAGAGQDGANIGVSLFTGQGTGLGDIGALNQITFDNVTLTAVPETATWAFWGGIASLLSAVILRRRPLVK